MTSNELTVTNQEIESFLKDAGCGQPERIEEIAREASHRRYFRVHVPNPCHGNRALIVCKTHPLVAPQSDDYLVLRKHLLESGINVPDLYHLREVAGLMLLQDGGYLDLSSYVHRANQEHNREARLDGLGKAIEVLVAIHGVTPIHPVTGRSFDFDKLHWEMEFMYSALMESFPDGAANLLTDEFKQDVRTLCDTLSRAEPFVLTHRDYHGRNLLVQNPDLPSEEIELMVIDFQDARLGLPWYDVSSLLYDPYTPIQRIERMKLLDYYMELTGFSQINPPGQLFYQQAMQRMLKALGTYLFFSREKGMQKFLENIPVALQNMEEITESGDLPDSFMDFIEKFKDLFH